MESTYKNTGCKGAPRPAAWTSERRRRLAEAIVAWHRASCGKMCDDRGMPFYMMNVGHECIKPFFLRYVAAKTKQYSEDNRNNRRDGDIGLGPVTPDDTERIWFELCLLRADVLDEIEKRFLTAAQ